MSAQPEVAVILRQLQAKVEQLEADNKLMHEEISAVKSSAAQNSATAVAAQAAVAAVAVPATPAVEATMITGPSVTGRLSAAGGVLGASNGAGSRQDSTAVPFSRAAQVQFDGGSAIAADAGYCGMAGQLFARDSHKGAIGLYGSCSFVNAFSDRAIGSAAANYSVARLGAGGELYFDRISLAAIMLLPSSNIRSVTVAGGRLAVRGRIVQRRKARSAMA